MILAMIAMGTILISLIQGLRRLNSGAAPALAAPPRPVYLGAEPGWAMPPNAHLPRLPGPVWSLLWFRLDRLASRLARLYDR